MTVRECVESNLEQGHGLVMATNAFFFFFFLLGSGEDVIEIFVLVFTFMFTVMDYKEPVFYFVLFVCLFA